jgi:NTE family protein
MMYVRRTIALWVLPLAFSTFAPPVQGGAPPPGSRPKVGLVLSGGGSRGLAQIGVLKVLERHHIPVDCIVGNSLGSVVGGLYASGYTVAEIENIATAADWSELLSFSEETKRTDLFVGQKRAQQDGQLVIRFDGLQPIIPSSISGGQRLSNFFSYVTLQAVYHPNPTFDGLKIPYRAVATDLLTGRRIVLDRGSLAEAMRASVTVPLLYAPLELDSMILVDGGLTSNIPVDVAKAMGCDLIIAVNSSSPMRGPGQLGAPWEIADQIMTIMMQEQNRRQLAAADVVITPDAGSRIVSDFSGIAGLISAGETAAESAIGRIAGRFGPAPASSAGNGERAPAHRPLIRTVRLEGEEDDLLEPAERDSVIGEITGRPADPDTVRDAVERLVREFRKRGYSLARVESTAFDSAEGELRLKIQAGRIEKISYEGNERTRDYVLRRELPFEEGDVFNIDKASQGMVNIKSTGLFAYVLLDVRYAGHQPAVVVKVKERSSELLRLGMHVDNEYAFVGGISIGDANFRGAGEDFSLLAKYGYRLRNVDLSYTINRLFHSYLTFNTRGYFHSRDVITYLDDPDIGPGRWERLEDGRYKENKYGWSFTFGSHFERFGDISARLRIENHQISAISGSGYVPERYRFIALKLQSIVDTEDKFWFPTSGMYLELSYESAAKGLGSDVSFGKVSLTYETYLSPLPRQTIRPRLQFGFADATLPIAEQFSLGGFDSFFGLREDDGRGRQLFLLSLEYRYHLPFRLIFDSYVSARYDLGTVSQLPEEIKLNSFRHGIGATVALDTPLGPASFGLGMSLFVRRDLPTSPVSVGPLLVYFSIGTTF